VNSPAPSLAPVADAELDTRAFVSQTLFYTSPVRLRAAAHLYGVSAAPVETARVLEIGCAAGENLLPFALAYPEAQVIGLDAAAERIAAGQARAQALGAANVALHTFQWDALDMCSGKFDYIIMNGVFGRIPGEATNELLRLCRDLLAPGGLACIGYSTYPGAKVQDVLRDAMMLHVAGAANDRELIDGARAALALFAEGMAPGNGHAAVLREEVARLRASSDDELVKEYLVGGSACYFVEFAAAMQDHGFSHIGDAQPQTEVAISYGNNVGLTNSLLGLGKDRYQRQQYLDMAVGRQRRTSLVVTEDRMYEGESVPRFDRLDSLRVAGSWRCLDADEGIIPKAVEYQSVQGEPLTVKDTTAQRAIAVLSAAWPASLSFGELCRLTPADALLAADVSHEEAVRAAIVQLAISGGVRYCMGTGPCDTAKGRAGLRLTPGALSAVRRTEDGDGWQLRWFGLWHDPVTLKLSEAEYVLLQEIEGKSSFSRLCDVLLDAAAKGRLAMPTAYATSAWAEVTVADLVARLRDAALLSADPAIWAAYHSSMLAQAESLPHRRLFEAADSLYLLASTCVPQAQRPQQLTAKDQNEMARLERSGNHGASERFARKLLERAPACPAAWFALCVALREQSRHAEAARACLRGLASAPLDAMLYHNIAVALDTLRQYDLAERGYRRAIALAPRYAKAYAMLGRMIRIHGLPTEAEGLMRRVTELEPNSVMAHGNLGSVLLALGKTSASIEAQRRCLSLDPKAHRFHSNLLFTLLHDDSLSPEQLFEEHLVFGRALEGERSISVHDNDRNPNRKLRLGFVSGDLRNHAVANFIEPIWAGLNSNEFDLYVYSNTDLEDDVSQRLRTRTAAWRNIYERPDDEVERHIRTDRIDILFDLSGHTGDNRLPVFARKPAPVQITWVGYPGSTGLRAMDYCVVESEIAPPGMLDEQFTEKLVYLPGLAFRTDFRAPIVSALPAKQKGYVTFASFNRLSKITDSTLALWAEVMAAVPDARLLLAGISDTSMQLSLRERAVEHGLDPSRMSLHPRMGMASYLQMHHQVDIVLDTFPYTGGTTTCHALSMGVPVLTLTQPTRVARQTAGILGALGLQHDWVADTREEYVARAVAWAGNLDALATLRAELRHRLERLEGAGGMAASLPAALRQMWSAWCEERPPQAILPR